jgi:23S rRNA pseudouridine2605 synthase
MRINKYLASCGVGSRRKVEEFILEGRVKINGTIVKDLSTIVEDSSNVTFDDKKVILQDKMEYILLNKPVRVVTTSNDQFDRKSVLDIVKSQYRIYPVGRLDYDSCGLIILTNDGDLAYKLTHPKNHIEKKYYVVIDGSFDSENKLKFESGIEIDGYMTRETKLKIVKEEDQKTHVIISLFEGRNRQIRKMMDVLGFKVLYLHRIAIGQVKDTKLKQGEYRDLTAEELEYLRSL